jgi:hypothetical protein
MQRSTSGSTELAASADQMSKMARIMLDLMERFSLETDRVNQNRELDGVLSQRGASIGAEPRRRVAAAARG